MCCVPLVKMVKMVKIVKMGWAAGVWVCTPSGNGENIENGENGENSENGIGCWGLSVYPRRKW